MKESVSYLEMNGWFVSCILEPMRSVYKKTNRNYERWVNPVLVHVLERLLEGARER